MLFIKLEKNQDKSQEQANKLVFNYLDDLKLHDFFLLPILSKNFKQKKRTEHCRF